MLRWPQYILDGTTLPSLVRVSFVCWQDADGRTPLFVCTASKGPGATDCMKTLLEFGAEVGQTKFQSEKEYDLEHTST